MGTSNVGSVASRTKAKMRKQGGAVSENAFDGQTERPTEKAVEASLGPSYAAWKQLVAQLKQELILDAAEWHSSAVKNGWALRLQLKKRNIVYLGSRAGYFLAAFVFGDKAVAVARKSELPAQVLKMIAETKRYGEGTPVRIEVSKPEDLGPVVILAKIKVEN